MINWFEIPAMDINRAKEFYGAMLGVSFSDLKFGNEEMALINSDKHPTGALVKGPYSVPSSNQGPLIYLSGGNDLSVPLAKVEEAGGKVIAPKTKISDEQGYFALFIDTEGNKMALHSMA